MILDYICQIIKDYMELEDNQIYIQNEKFNLPKDQKFCVTVGFTGNSKIVGTSRSGVELEKISTTLVEPVVVDIFGRTPDVLTRRHEITMAFNSSIGNEIQQKYGFRIGANPTSYNNISGIDGAAIPYRFQFIFQVQYKTEKEKSVSYYDTFEKEVKTNE